MTRVADSGLDLCRIFEYMQYFDKKIMHSDVNFDEKHELSWKVRIRYFLFGCDPNSIQLVPSFCTLLLQFYFFLNINDFQM